VAAILRRLFSSRALLLALSLALILAGLSRVIDIRTPNRPTGSWEGIRKLASRDDLNVVFVLIDTLRADRLSAYGYERPTSPVIAGLADSGVRFATTLAQSTWTKCSMASLWSATYPVTNQITRWPHGVPEAMQSPAELLQQAGFRTVGIWRNGWVAPNFGFAQGFDLYFKPTVHARPPQLAQNNPSAAQLPGTDHGLTMAAVEFLQSAGDERFLLHLHYMDVHQYVYDASADFGTGYSDIYDNSIRWVDANVGTIVATLQEKELMERTLLVISSDHGEAFNEHRREGHAKNLYRETTNVPLVIALPFRLNEGIVVETPVENVDIWPTILDLLGLDAMPHAEGRSLVPLMEASAQGTEDPSAPAAQRPVFAYLDRSWGIRGAAPRPMASISKDGYRLMRHLDRDATGLAEDGVELYDVAADPDELNDLSEQNPEEVARLEAVLEEFLARPRSGWGPPEEVAVSDMELGQLRALGYALPKAEEAGGENDEGDAESPQAE
jgi:arylsulfatase A-like enzyme